MFRNIEDHISYVVINHSLSAWISSMFRLTIRAVRTYGHLHTAWVAIRSTKSTNDSFVPLCITILRKRRSYHRLGSAIRIVELSSYHRYRVPHKASMYSNLCKKKEIVTS